jgi:hypothetical protein
LIKWTQGLGETVYLVPYLTSVAEGTSLANVVIWEVNSKKRREFVEPSIQAGRSGKVWEVQRGEGASRLHRKGLKQARILGAFLNVAGLFHLPSWPLLPNQMHIGSFSSLIPARFVNKIMVSTVHKK